MGFWFFTIWLHNKTNNQRNFSIFILVFLVIINFDKYNIKNKNGYACIVEFEAPMLFGRCI